MKKKYADFENDDYTYPDEKDRVEVTEANRSECIKALEELHAFAKESAEQLRKENYGKR